MSTVMLIHWWLTFHVPKPFCTVLFSLRPIYFLFALKYFIGVFWVRRSKGHLIDFGPQISRQSPPPQEIDSCLRGLMQERREVPRICPTPGKEYPLCQQNSQYPGRGTLLSTSCHSLLMKWQEPLPGHPSYPNSTSPRGKFQTLGLQPPGYP